MHSSATRLIHNGFNLHQQGQLDEAERLYRQALAKDTNNFDALYLLGILKLQTSDFPGASEFLVKAVALNPMHLDAHLHLGAAFAQSGRVAAAIDHFKRAQTLDPKNPVAFFNLGLAYAGLEKYEEAILEFKKAVALSPHYAEAMNNLGNALHKTERYTEAADCFSKALDIAPGYLNPLLGLSAALCKQEKYAEALIKINELLQKAHDSSEAHDNKGLVLAGMKDFEGAIGEYKTAIQLCPTATGTFSNLGLAYAELSRFDEAFVAYDKAIRLNPSHVEAHNNLGLLYAKFRRFNEAFAAYDKAIQLKPCYVEAHNNLGLLYAELKRFDEAIAAYNVAFKLKPDNAATYQNLGSSYRGLKQFTEAISAFKSALELTPSTKWLPGELLHICMNICDWSNYTDAVTQVRKMIRNREKGSAPFPLLGLPTTASEQKQAAETFCKTEFSSPPPLPQSQHQHSKIKVAYLSADYHNHATAYLMAELFELHDRTRFEIVGICYGRSPDDQMRTRVSKSFDQFFEVADKSDLEIAKLAQELEIDVAVDLKGHTQDTRLGVFAHRPAPIQIHYLGYPGTLGTNFIDYLVADPMLIPQESREFYVEKIAYLPDTYQVNDRSRCIADTHNERSDHRLPEQGFVFCCFNNNWKITPDVFDIWARLLKRIDDSVLWLFKDNDDAAANLQREAASRGIDPSRLIFAERMPLDQHLSRHKHADLFLDTLYYNAHTTASDALWAGLPVLTKLGETYASRVAASLLTAVGLPELITHSLEDYENRAVDLATHPEKLKAIRTKLADNRLTTPLFDTPRFTRHLEIAYEQMVARHRQGLAPDHIYVTADPIH